LTLDAEPLDRTTFRLHSGRSIELVAIDQSRTYARLLAGAPTRRMNQRIMDGLIARYVEPGGYGVPLLLEPDQRMAADSATGAGSDAAAASDPPAALPPIVCVARFMSSGVGGTGDIWSVLRVIWFQDDFAFPIDQRVRSQIAALDWDAHAVTWEP
jgi:hypothetical protein